MHNRTTMIALLSIAAAAAAPAWSAEAAGAEAPAPAAKWRILFDGTMNDSFRGWRSEGMPDGWHVVDGTLAKEGSVDDLVTREQFGNFELELEWKIGKAGNRRNFLPWHPRIRSYLLERA